MNIDLLNSDLSKKEYQQLSLKPRDITSHKWNENFLDEYVGLELHTGQQFAKNWLNINNKHTRILLKHETGTGKTIAQIATMMVYVKYYKDNYNMDATVYVIGFSERIFKNELLNRFWIYI